MQYYEPDKNTTGKRAGAIAIVVYLGLLAILGVFYNIGITRQPSYDGILIDFGDAGGGPGGHSPGSGLSGMEQSAISGEVYGNSAADNDFLTQDFEDAPAIAASGSERNRTEQRQVASAQSAAQEPARTVNRRALFPGSTSDANTGRTGSGSGAGSGYGTGSGSGTGTGDGDGLGTGTGSGTGSGSGNGPGVGPGSEEGHSFSLRGRTLVGNLPGPKYPDKNKSGKVVIEITVDATGKVTTAEYVARGSTTQDEELVLNAKNAALRAKFSPDSKNLVQTGTITYIFTLK